jgi:hypothetical protein
MDKGITDIWTKNWEADTDSWLDRQTEGQTDGQTDRWREGKETDGLLYEGQSREIDGVQGDRQQTDRWIHRHANNGMAIKRGLSG